MKCQKTAWQKCPKTKKNGKYSLSEVAKIPQIPEKNREDVTSVSSLVAAIHPCLFLKAWLLIVKDDSLSKQQGLKADVSLCSTEVFLFLLQTYTMYLKPSGAETPTVNPLPPWFVCSDSGPGFMFKKEWRGERNGPDHDGRSASSPVSSSSCSLFMGTYKTTELFTALLHCNVLRSLSIDSRYKSFDRFNSSSRRRCKDNLSSSFLSPRQ